ncbi:MULTISPECIES: OadG family protein [Pelosinus]|uniref:OadG family protein n=1 Tax=Pelosinus TaxID=365348 RepID=UPI0002685442|nr:MULTISPECIES: OadG family protein [Pelosinus]EIW25254.1 sodium pump decarboxylase gamma subunit [Pelosinus fermentans A11]OAM93736.1 sodium pump decarboxylase gamma subunit [Pelosinus fermentans DSM 17108]SDQ88282.1 Oxaloacetate decarboxylase, gamma chain [Pelosinus fermentans]
MGQPITTNPILIALINMTVVFAVLYGLSLVVRLIQVIDPTQKKKREETESNSLVKTAATATETNVLQEDYDEMIILFTAAVAAYGYSNMRVVSIRSANGSTWSQAARMEMVSTRNQMN